MPVPYHLPWSKEYKFAAHRALVHRKSGSIISFIPKNACSSIKSSLVCDAFGYEVEEFKNIVSTGVHAATPHVRADISEILAAQNSYILLRSPLERLASVFTDKFAEKWPEAVYLAAAVLDVKVDSIHTLSEDLKARIHDYISGLTFVEFIKLLKVRKYLNVDHHWRPQTNFLLYKDYTYVGYMGRIKEFADRLSSDLNLEWIDSRPFMQHDRTRFESVSIEGAWDLTAYDLNQIKQTENVVPDTQSMFSEECLKLAREIYSADFEYIEDKLGIRISNEGFVAGSNVGVVASDAAGNEVVDEESKLQSQILRMKEKFAPHLICDEETDLVIEGYPRSANTFTVDFINYLIGNSPAKEQIALSIAHHTHSIKNLEIGVKLGKPCIALIREPEAAIRSFHIYSGLTLKQAADKYVDFYKHVYEIASYCCLARFEDIVSDFNSVLQAINREFGYEIPSSENLDEDVARVQEIDKQRALRERDEQEYIKTVGAPIPEREQLKKEATQKVKDYLENDLRPLAIYKSLLHTCKLLV